MDGCTPQCAESAHSAGDCKCACEGAYHGRQVAAAPAVGRDGVILTATPPVRERPAPSITTFTRHGVFLPEHGVSVSVDDEHETTFTIDPEDGRWLKTRSQIGDDACWHEHPTTKVTLGQVVATVAHDKQALNHVIVAHLAAHKALNSTRGIAIANRALKPHGLHVVA